MFCRGGLFPTEGTLACVSEDGAYSDVGHSGLCVRLSEAMWLRTGFAAVIGDVGVIIEDLEEQESYFRVIDFSLPLAMLSAGGVSTPNNFFGE